MESNPIDQNSKKSVSKSEVGHVKNVANFQTLTTFCQSYGGAYQPIKDALKIENALSLFVSSQNALNKVINKKTTNDNAIELRRVGFADLRPFSTRLVNSFAVSGVDKLIVDNLKSVNRKLQGSQTKKSDESKEKSISNSQQSFDRLMDHFAKMIEIVQQNNFTTNEPEFKIEALIQRLEKLKTLNTNVINTYTEYANAMIDRDILLYNPLTGLVQIAKEIKQYIKSVFGASSPQFLQISGLVIRKYTTRY